MKTFWISILVLLLASPLIAQEPWEVNQESKFKDRIILGGNLGLSFGDVTYVDISPRIGYRATNKLIVGFGGSYRYRKDKRFVPDLESSDYSFNLFSRYSVYGPIFLHAEYEYLNYEFFLSAAESVRRDANSVLVGGGLAQPIGNRAVFIIEALYNLSYENDIFYPYADPWVFRVGIGVGL